MKFIIYSRQRRGSQQAAKIGWTYVDDNPYIIITPVASVKALTSWPPFCRLQFQIHLE